MDNVICEYRCIKKDLIVHHIFVFNIKNNFYKFSLLHQKIFYKLQ